MSNHGTDLLAEAMQLSDGDRADRADLAAHLIDSLDPEIDGDYETAWSEEIRNRIEELDSGRVQPVAWPEARLRIHF